MRGKNLGKALKIENCFLFRIVLNPNKARRPTTQIEVDGCRFQIPLSVTAHFSSDYLRDEGYKVGILSGINGEGGVIYVEREHGVSIADFVSGQPIPKLDDCERIIDEIHAAGKLAVGYSLRDYSKPQVDVVVMNDWEKQIRTNPKALPRYESIQ